VNDEALNKPIPPTNDAAAHLPAWYPDWARLLADSYFAGTHCCFVLHGNVHDLFGADESDESGHCSLREFLATQLFGNWDVLLHYNVGQGLRPFAGGNAERFEEMIKRLAPIYGEPATWPRDPDKVLALLNQIVERNIVSDSGKRISVAVLFDYAQYLLPSGDANALGPAQAARLVRVLGWAQNPYIKRTNIAFCLIADQLAELNDRIVTNPHVATIEVPLPDRDLRASFIHSKLNPDRRKLGEEFTGDQLAEQSSGLSLVNLDVLLAGAQSRKQDLSRDEFRRLKKEMIERECGNLL
jgi:transitional endoplasmic reticulum ATPase